MSEDPVDLGLPRPCFSDPGGAVVGTQHEQGRSPLAPAHRRVPRAPVERAAVFEHRRTDDSH
jgi:hypothetical protein